MTWIKQSLNTEQATLITVVHRMAYFRLLDVFWKHDFFQEWFLSSFTHYITTRNGQDFITPANTSFPWTYVPTRFNSIQFWKWGNPILKGKETFLFIFTQYNSVLLVIKVDEKNIITTTFCWFFFLIDIVEEYLPLCVFTTYFISSILVLYQKQLEFFFR